MINLCQRLAIFENGAEMVKNPGEEQDGAGDRCHDGPRPLGHRLGRQKTGRGEPEAGIKRHLNH